MKREHQRLAAAVAMWSAPANETRASTGPWEALPRQREKGTRRGALLPASLFLRSAPAVSGSAALSCCAHVRPDNPRKARSEAVAHPVTARRPLPGGPGNNAWTALGRTELNSVTCCSWHQTLHVQWPGWLEGGPGCEASPLPSYLLGISPLRAVHPQERGQAPRN